MHCVKNTQLIHTFCQLTHLGRYEHVYTESVIASKTIKSVNFELSRLETGNGM